ncbi:MAG: hypothetical protein R3D67_15160 [Hyphomicrobiaceae bacterium]
MSADANFDVNRYLTIGGKYGFRIGQVSASRSKFDFIDSSAHLGVIRADFHVVKNWDVMLEFRALHHGNLTRPATVPSQVSIVTSANARKLASAITWPVFR